MLHYPSSGSLACIPLVYQTSTIFLLTTIHSWSWLWSLTFQVSMSLLVCFVGFFLILKVVTGKANNCEINIHITHYFCKLLKIIEGKNSELKVQGLLSTNTCKTVIHVLSLTLRILNNGGTPWQTLTSSLLFFSLTYRLSGERSSKQHLKI